ncbi:MAG: hypothetical protein NVSMB42_02390 [Herpetosiphon sp.]
MLSISITIFLIGVVFLRRLSGKSRFAVAIVAVSLLANLVSVLLYYLVGDGVGVPVIVATREILIDLLFVFSGISILSIVIYSPRLIDRIYLALLLIFGIMILLSKQDLKTAILSGRELIFPLATYFVFRSLRLDEPAQRRVIRFLVRFSVVTALLAIVEQIYVNLFDPNFWTGIQIDGYLTQKYGTFTGDYPLSWMNYAPGYFNLPPTLRSVGLLVDPLATAHILACGFTIVLYYRRGALKYILLAILALGTICTFSKGALLICFIAIGTQAFALRNKALRYMSLAMVALIVVALATALLRTGDDAATHFGSFRAGVTSLAQSPLGDGIGSTGYFTYLVTGDGDAGAVDTTFSVYTVQLGWLGLLALFCLLGAPFFTVLHSFRQVSGPRKQAPLALVCLSLWTAYSILSFSTAAAFTAVPILIPMALLGIEVANQAHRSSMPHVAVAPTMKADFA